MAGGFGNIRAPMVIPQEEYRSVFSPQDPELNDISVPAIERKDVTELNVKAAALAGLPAIQQIPRATDLASFAEMEQNKINNALRNAYTYDRIRLERDKRITKNEEKKLSKALERRDANAGKSLARRGNAKRRFAQQRIRDIARNTRLGPHLYRVLK